MQFTTKKQHGSYTVEVTSWPGEGTGDTEYERVVRSRSGVVVQKVRWKNGPGEDNEPPLSPDSVVYRARQLGKSQQYGFAKPDGFPDPDEVREQIRKTKKKQKRSKCRKHGQFNCRHPAC